ncbi:MAG: Hsp20/alpha crystallin family protein [Candidatus Thermoplasmatota archaeon]|jgi:HSP20 family molecular chaperone IbpA|nr:Hsp20/alpha crystallin family protein [Candidatus Thermoplasmatota archaeon]MCL5800704.1 Hsp20/alpha crystallin family protein [Candidatus Thermoplasmatota archaeon]
MYSPLKFYAQEMLKNIGDRGKEILSFIYPPITMYESGTDIIIEADMPGFEKKEIDVRLDNNAVLINASRKKEEAGTTFIDQRPEKISKRIRLPYDVDQGAEITAKYQNGVLTLTIPAKGLRAVKVE